MIGSTILAVPAAVGFSVSALKNAVNGENEAALRDAIIAATCVSIFTTGVQRGALGSATPAQNSPHSIEQTLNSVKATYERAAKNLGLQRVSNGMSFVIDSAGTVFHSAQHAVETVTALVDHASQTLFPTEPTLSNYIARDTGPLNTQHRDRDPMGD